MDVLRFILITSLIKYSRRCVLREIFYCIMKFSLIFSTRLFLENWIFFFLSSDIQYEFCLIIVYECFNILMLIGSFYCRPSSLLFFHFSFSFSGMKLFEALHACTLEGSKLRQFLWFFFFLINIRDNVYFEIYFLTNEILFNLYDKNIFGKSIFVQLFSDISFKFNDRIWMFYYFGVDMGF